MTISTKVAVAFSIAIALVGGLATALAIHRQAAEQRREFRTANREALELFALAIAPSLAEGSHHQAQAVLDNIANFPERYADVRALEVIDLSGHVFADVDPRRYGERARRVEHGQLTAGAPTIVEVGRGELEMAVPIRLAHPLGLLRARVDETGLDVALRRQQRSGGLLVIATMVVVGLLVYALHRRLLGTPVAALASAVAGLRAGRMTVRVDVRGDDELARLARGFNEMATHLEKYTGDLEQANQRLQEPARTDAPTGPSSRSGGDP